MQLRWPFIIVLVLVVVGLVVLFVHMTGGPSAGEEAPATLAEEQKPTPVYRPPENIDMHMRVYSGGYSPDIIEAVEGDFVTIHLRSTDGLAHGFVIDDLGIAERIDPGVTVDITFRAKHEGVYEFYSHVPSNPNVANIKGKVVVK